MSFKCKECNKEYKSYQSLWNHNKKFHILTMSDDSPITVKLSDKCLTMTDIKEKNKKYICIKCNKIFNNRKTKWSHEQKCNETNEIKLKKENEILKNKVEIFEKEMSDMKMQMTQLMNKLCKIHPKTLTKINNNLTNNITNNDNKVINNINIIQLGSESLDTLFNATKQIEVLNKRNKCLEELIKDVHFNDKNPQWKNSVITNVNNNIAYTYDKIENKFIAITKKELIDAIINARMGDIQTFYENQIELLDERTREIINKFIDKMDDNDSKYYEYKMNEIKLLIYNNRNKVSLELPQEEIVV